MARIRACLRSNGCKLEGQSTTTPAAVHVRSQLGRSGAGSQRCQRHPHSRQGGVYLPTTTPSPMHSAAPLPFRLHSPPASLTYQRPNHSSPNPDEAPPPLIGSNPHWLWLMVCRTCKGTCNEHNRRLERKLHKVPHLACPCYVLICSSVGFPRRCQMASALSPRRASQLHLCLDCSSRAKLRT